MTARPVAWSPRQTRSSAADAVSVVRKKPVASRSGDNRRRSDMFRYLRRTEARTLARGVRAFLAVARGARNGSSVSSRAARGFRSSSRQCFVRGCGRFRKGSARLGGERVTFSCLSKRKSPKRRTPHGARPREEAPRVRARRPVAPTVRPCTDGAMGAIHRAHPAGHFGRRPPAADGEFEEQSTSGATQGKPACKLPLALRAQERAFALPGFPCVPASGWRKSP